MITIAKILLPKMHTESWILLSIAILNAFAAFMTWKTRTDMAEVVTATNGMKTALVAATDKAAHAVGKEEGRMEGEAKAAVLAQGQLQSETKPPTP